MNWIKVPNSQFISILKKCPDRDSNQGSIGHSNWVENLAYHMAQVAAESKNSRELYIITKQLSNKTLVREEATVKSSSVSKVTAPSDQLIRWREYFRGTVGAPSEPLERQHEMHAKQHNLRISTNEPSTGEIKRAINQLKSRPDRTTFRPNSSRSALLPSRNCIIHFRKHVGILTKYKRN
jgi:hypothetical protein